MILTGKCREDFEKWLIANEEIQDIKNKDKDMHHWLTFKGFKNIPFSMQFGVMVDFFSNQGYDVDVDSNTVFIFSNKTIYSNGIESVEGFVYTEDCKSRPEARTEAIKKANEIVNSKK